MFLAWRRIEAYTCLPKNVRVKRWAGVKVTGRRSNLSLEGHIYHFCVGDWQTLLDIYAQYLNACWIWRAKRCSLCCTITARTQTLTLGLKWPYQNHESKLVIFWPRRAGDTIILKAVEQSDHYHRTCVATFLHSVSMEVSWPYVWP